MSCDATSRPCSATTGRPASGSSPTTSFCMSPAARRWPASIAAASRSEGYLHAALARSYGARVEVELVDMLASEERVALVVRERFGRPGGAVEIRRANLYRLRGDQIVEVWIFEANQYEVDELLADPRPGG